MTGRRRSRRRGLVPRLALPLCCLGFVRLVRPSAPSFPRPPCPVGLLFFSGARGAWWAGHDRPSEEPTAGACPFVASDLCASCVLVAPDSCASCVLVASDWCASCVLVASDWCALCVLVASDLLAWSPFFALFLLCSSRFVPSSPSQSTSSPCSAWHVGLGGALE